MLCYVKFGEEYIEFEIYVKILEDIQLNIQVWSL